MPWLKILYGVEWLIRIVMIFEVPRRRAPTSATAWLMIVFFFPIPGLIAYLLVGANRPRPGKILRFDVLKDVLAEAVGFYENEMKRFRVRLPAAVEDFSLLVERLGGLSAFGGNRMEILDDPDDFIDQLVRDIDSAVHHVHMLFYIVEDDSVGRRVTDALQSAAERGVSCRLLADSLVSRKFFLRRWWSLHRKGIEIFDALPIVSIRRYFGRVDWRNHRKIVVIDGRVAYTGSRNIVEPNYGHKHSALVWKDLMVRIQGPAIIPLQAVFLSDWYMESGRLVQDTAYFSDPPQMGDMTIQVMPSGPIYSSQNYRQLVLTALYRANSNVTITTPYFIPDEAILQALETAVKRGVEINLILPKKSDQWLPGFAARSYFHDLLEWGVNVYRFTEGLLHAKSLSVDDQLCFFGSSNFDIRSFALASEVDLVFYGAKPNELLRERQAAYMEDSELLTLDGWYSRPLWNRLPENLAKLFSPIL